MGGGNYTLMYVQARVKALLTATILIVLFSGCIHLYGVTRYVNTMADPAVADGTMQFPFVEIQDAIVHLQYLEGSHTIHVAPGEMTPTVA